MRFLLLFLFTLSPAYGWWCEGHQVVARIAQEHLSAHASAAVNALLKANPVEPSLQRFCQTSGNSLMADASTWADDAKKTEKTETWHYMDLPLGMKHGDLMEYCEPVGPSHNGQLRSGCLLSALRYNLNVLHDPKESDAERATALRYLIHLIGDLHQPLHTTSNNDQGGNCVPLHFLEEQKATNLHSVWDGMILNQAFPKSQHSLAEVAKDLDTRFATKREAWTKHGVAFDQWVRESHKIAQDAVYGDLKPKIVPEPFEAKPNCKVEAEKNGSLHLHIQQSYEEKAAPVVEQQIAKAGYRLAEVLNEIWP